MSDNEYYIWYECVNQRMYCSNDITSDEPMYISHIWLGQKWLTSYDSYKFDDLQIIINHYDCMYWKNDANLFTYPKCKKL